MEDTVYTPKLIPLSEIDELAKNIAIQWIENYTPNGSIYPEIAQKQKLASDIINYARKQNSELQKQNHVLKQALEFDAACKTDLDCRITELENLLKKCLVRCTDAKMTSSLYKEIKSALQYDNPLT